MRRRSSLAIASRKAVRIPLLNAHLQKSFVARFKAFRQRNGTTKHYNTMRFEFRVKGLWGDGSMAQ